MKRALALAVLAALALVVVAATRGLRWAPVQEGEFSDGSVVAVQCGNAGGGGPTVLGAELGPLPVSGGGCGDVDVTAQAAALLAAGPLLVSPATSFGLPPGPCPGPARLRLRYRC